MGDIAERNWGFFEPQVTSMCITVVVSIRQFRDYPACH